MEYEFLDSSIEKDNIILPNSDKINPLLLKNNYADIIKALDFIASEEKFLYIHGFMGTGKRQFINYISDFISKDVIKLEYYCKEATVCDDILLTFTDLIDNHSISKAINLNAKITTLSSKFQQQISSIKKPFLIILHSLDDILGENLNLVTKCFANIAKESNTKIIVSTRGMKPNVLDSLEEDRKIFLKAFTKEIFQEFLDSNDIKASEKNIEDFYACTRGYYYYVALSIKIIQAMKTDLAEFLRKYIQSGTTFDSFLSITYINLVPSSIRNFFWFLRHMRHGLTLNALAVFDVYDEFSLEYLKTNLMIFQAEETVYVQDFFLQKIDISIPEKTEIKLHKYISGIYEKQLKESIKNRVITISRQALRAEIEYHNNQIKEIEEGKKQTQNLIPENNNFTENEITQTTVPENSISYILNSAQEASTAKNFTEAIELYEKALNKEDLDLVTLIDIRTNLAKLYKEIGEYTKSSNYYDLVETYYKQHKEFINLNYLYYEITDLYYKMYKNERAIETIKKVIYSVDTPQSLMVSSCILLGNIYSETNNIENAYTYYNKALESLDLNVENNILSELYFKLGLVNDDKDNLELAFEYYNKCVVLPENSPYKALAYSNLASCYYENNSYDDALNCFIKAYELEKAQNNYDGIYYNASNIAKIYMQTDTSKALKYLTEAKSSAEFINEQFYILESTLALGDYYYNSISTIKEALIEYFKASKLSKNSTLKTDTTKISQRINDMKLRMSPKDFKEIEDKYGKF